MIVVWTVVAVAVAVANHEGTSAKYHVNVVRNKPAE